MKVATRIRKEAERIVELARTVLGGEGNIGTRLFLATIIDSANAIIEKTKEL